MNKSESIKSLAVALCKAQGEMQKAHKKSDNPFFNSTYANLSEVLTCVKETFTSNGLCFTQMPSFDSGVVSVETMLMHESGEWMTSTSGAPISKNNPQGVGDAITYLRRYSLAAISGLAQEDDDGNSNSNPKDNKGKSDDKPWYNDFEAQKSQMIECIQRGTDTADNIIKALSANFKLSKEVRAKITELK